MTFTPLLFHEKIKGKNKIKDASSSDNNANSKRGLFLQRAIDILLIKEAFKKTRHSFIAVGRELQTANQQIRVSPHEDMNRTLIAC